MDFFEDEPGALRPTAGQSVLRVNRQLTDKIVGIIFTISFLLWLTTIIYVISVPVRSTSTIPIFEFRELDIARIFIALGYICLCGLFTYIAFMALRWIPHVTNVVLWTYWILVSIYIAAAVHQATFWSIYTALGAVLGCILLLSLLNREWFHLSEKVLKEACKMILSVPSTAVLALFVCLLNAFLIGIIAAVAEKLISSDQSFILPTLLVIANLAFGGWTVVAVAALGLMTLSGTFAEYYWAENKNSISLGTVLRLFAVNCRYHIGTAAMCHPLLGGLIVLAYHVMNIMLAIGMGGGCIGIRAICFYLYNIFDMLLFRMSMLGSAARCGIKGENFKKSLEGAMALLMNTKTLTVVKVMELLLELSTLIIMVLTAFSTLGYLDHTIPGESKNSWQQSFSILVISGEAVFVVAFLTCLTAACYSIMLCFQDEMNYFENRVPQDFCAMSSNLHSALKHGGPPKWFRNSYGRCVPDFDILN